MNGNIFQKILFRNPESTIQQVCNLRNVAIGAFKNLNIMPKKTCQKTGLFLLLFLCTIIS
ncbi:hypothetical protein EGY05_10350 [Chryseobacterium arthrosphaerae]|nr:hypothetical protein EGY05_10350 [Chryseobacterium arthrosphaerae]